MTVVGLATSAGHQIAILVWILYCRSYRNVELSLPRRPIYAGAADRWALPMRSGRIGAIAIGVARTA